MLRSIRTLTLAGATALVLVACGDSTLSHAPAVPPPTLQTLEVKPERAPLERQLDGAIEAVNQGTVAAQTAGRVADVLYDVNDFVPAGAVIMKLRATEQRSGLLQAQAALREATARESEAQTRYQRIADMYDRKVMPKATLDEATANRDATVARLVAARAALESAQEGVAYTEVRAPYAGIVTQRHVEVGETVAPGTPLMSGQSLQYLRVAVDVPQSIVEQIRRIRKAAVYVDGKRVEATKLTVFPEAASASNTFRTRVELPENAADLYPGMFVKVGFVVGETERLLIPVSSLVRRSEVTAVYVIGADGRVTLRQIRTGHRFGERIEVLSGLRPAEQIALDPITAARYLKTARVNAKS